MKFQNLFLNIVVDHVVYPLHEIINQSLESRKFPKNLSFLPLNQFLKKAIEIKWKTAEKNWFTAWATGIGTQLSNNPKSNR